MGVAIGICSAVERVRWGAWEETVTMAPRVVRARRCRRRARSRCCCPPTTPPPEAPDELLDRIDALMLAGGADVDPASYGARPHPETKGTWPERDRFELGLVHRALERDMPVLGICRGMQMLNVASGGTLEQHLPDVVGHADHRHTPGTFGDHEVRLEPGSLAARAAGAERLAVKSHHHQGADELGEGVTATGWAIPDDIVEAIELRRPCLRARRALAPRGGHEEPGDRARWWAQPGPRRGRDDRGAWSPPPRQVMAEVPRAGAEEVDAAVAAARGGVPGVAGDRARPSARRCCARLADALEAEAEELAVLEARNAGKPIGDARGEMGMVVETFRYYAGAPERLLGDTIPVAGGVDMTFREPLGVVGLIVPWNFPLVIASWKVAPALAAGNTIVLKPAELTPLTALELERIALEAGLPEGVLNVVAGPGSVCGQRLVEHPDVAKIAFTGSTEVGRGIAARRGRHDQARDAGAGWQVGQRRVRRRRPRAGRGRGARWPCSATPARTAARARGSWWSAAPWTTSSTLLGEHVRELRVGDPLDEATQMGPLISADQRDSVASYVRRRRPGGRARRCARTGPASGSRPRCWRRCRTTTARRWRRSSARWCA